MINVKDEIFRFTWGAAKAEATRERITKGVILWVQGGSVNPIMVIIHCE